MNHTIGIVAHTSRAEQAHKLAETVDATYLSMDDGQYGCEGNHHRTWQWLQDFATTEWALTLEDDAEPVPAFREQVTAALAASPAPVVSLYLGRLRPPHWQNAIQYATERANQHNAHFIRATHLLHAVAVAIRTDLIPDMLANTRTSRRPWDFAIAAWALQSGHQIAYTWPSLCDHTDGPPAITRHPDKAPRPPGRKAWQVGDRDVWEPTTVEMNQ